MVIGRYHLKAIAMFLQNIPFQIRPPDSVEITIQIDFETLIAVIPGDLP
jgi:hypothetical protein